MISECQNLQDEDKIQEYLSDCHREHSSALQPQQETQEAHARKKPRLSESPPPTTSGFAVHT